MDSDNNRRRIYTVSRLNQEVLQTLEQSFGTLWLQGEISNFSRPASGHFYFSLKDSHAQIRCAMFKGRNRHVDFRPQDGDAVLVRGKLGLYAARGDFQLIVEHMEPAGTGKLQAEFEATKRRLDADGWFAQEHKLALPAMPARVGVVTSTTGAAVRDVLHVLARRYPQAPVVLYPTLVQGAAAAPDIVGALQRADRRGEVDVLLLVRGGGSIEDLWAFNEVIVAAAIRACRIPIVTGIGHEVDITIADLVSDLRAPTPSAAAELATPDGVALGLRAREAERALRQRIERHVASRASSLQSLSERLQARHPERLLRERVQRCDELEQRLRLAANRMLERNNMRLKLLFRRLQGRSPRNQLVDAHAELRTWKLRLTTVMHHTLSQSTGELQSMARALNAVSPLAVLERGYAVVHRQRQVVSDVATVNSGDAITTRVANGEIDSIVQSTRKDISAG